jgi:hypothetical protein
MSKEKKRFLLRIDQELYNVLEKWAADEFRSVNAQIEYILKKAAQKAGRYASSNQKEEAKK